MQKNLIFLTFCRRPLLLVGIAAIMCAGASPAIANSPLPAAEADRPANQIFFENYVDSREKFRTGCQALPAPRDCESWTVPSRLDSDLTADWVYSHPGTSTKLVVFVAGLHGAEGLAGAALLHQLMAKWMTPMNAKGLHVLLVHAANPFGMKYGRRTTENNVDLNRNFPAKETAPREPNQGYAKMKGILEPEGAPGSIFGGFARLSSRLLTQLALGRFSLEEMRNAVAGGQVEFEKGLFYGGKTPEPQTEWLGTLFKRIFASYKEIFVVDLHTGLGKRGVLHLMPSGSPSEKAVQLRNRIFPPVGDTAPIYELTAETSTGFYRVRGGFLEFAEAQVTNDQTVLALTMEFGTLGKDIFNQLRSLNRMVQENQGAHHGYSSPESRNEIQDNFRELFYPSAPEWRTQILGKGEAIFSLLQTNF